MCDDWRDETQTRLDRSKIYQVLKSKCSDAAGSHVLSLVDEATYYAYHRTKIVLRHMGEFTLHDGEHLFRVLKLMERLLPESILIQLSTPELMLLVLSAFFHDIGMAPSEGEVKSWKKIWDSAPSFDSQNEENEYGKFKRYCSARPNELDKIDCLVNEGNNSTADILKGYLVSDYIRNTHAIRAKEVIQEHWSGKIKYKDTDLTVEFAEICFSHNEDALALLDFDKSFLCGQDTYACLPLIAVILRLADILDFDAKRTPSILFSHLAVRNPVSIREWNKHRAIEAWNISHKEIGFQAKCNHPAIESAIRSFCDLIDKELSIANNVIASINDFNSTIGRDICLKLPLKVNRDRIETKRNVFGKPAYLYKETQFNLSKRQVVDLLMGTKLYGNPEVALRELLQNSIDACLLRQALENKWGNPFSPEIAVNYYTSKGEDILEIIDNGTGMDQYIIDNFYSKVGSSFYTSAEFYDLKSEANVDFIPTSRFGIGILSCFMVADELVVDTRRVYEPHKSSEPLNITVEGQESIFWIKDGERKTPGTSTKLILRKNKNPWGKMTQEQFIKSVENVIPNPPFKISINTNSNKKIHDENSFKSFTADSLRDYSWAPHEYIREIELSFDRKDMGIIGSAIVGILEEHSMPVKRIDVTSKNVEVDGESFELDKTIVLAENSIELSFTSISIDVDNDITSESHTRDLAKSEARLSLHGIEVPTSLFPDFWERHKSQVKLLWPFPLLLVVDICSRNDLDLNSSRTQVIMSDKWIKFEEDLSFIICSGIAGAVTDEYWSSLKQLLTDCKNETFLNGLKRVAK